MRNQDGLNGALSTLKSQSTHLMLGCNTIEKLSTDRHCFYNLENASLLVEELT